jgi:pimeloyl-ACP methyl ester carboxylesterase
VKKIFLFLLMTISFPAFARKQIVLVPGFFSSLIPAPVVGGNPWKQPYFSQDIVNYLAKTGDRLWVVDNLDPLAGVEGNGNQVIEFLKVHKAEMGNDPLLLIGHSAGGLYALHAAARSDFPIKHIITVSTPFLGLTFLQNLNDHHIPIDSIIEPFCLRNLIGLEEVPVRQYLQSLQFRQPLRLDVFTGYQNVSVEFWNWRHLSTPLVAIDALIGEKSDGIVSVQSGLGAVSVLGKTPNLNIQTHSDPIGLEHWEFSLDPKISLVFGVLNLSSLGDAQQRAYHDILVQAGY